MAGPLSNPSPSSGSNAYPGGVKQTVRRGGTKQRPSIPVTEPGTRGKSATTTGVGTEDKNPPESGRARQDAASGTVHGQPKSHYNRGN
jgi:hypothetical protein